MQYQVLRAVQAANKLINRDNVFIMVANVGTPMDNATMPNSSPRAACRTIFPLTAEMTTEGVALPSIDAVNSSQALRPAEDAGCRKVSLWRG
jgi:hypothetical protein